MTDNIFITSEPKTILNQSLNSNVGVAIIDTTLKLNVGIKMLHRKIEAILRACYTRCG